MTSTVSDEPTPLLPGKPLCERGGSVDGLVATYLVAKYARYRDQPPAGPVVEVTVTRWSGWAYARP